MKSVLTLVDYVCYKLILMEMVTNDIYTLRKSLIIFYLYLYNFTH